MPINFSILPTLPSVSVRTHSGAPNRGELICDCGCGVRFIWRPRKRFANARCRARWHRREKENCGDGMADLIRAIHGLVERWRARMGARIEEGA